jgi:hypothetical protein
MTKLFYLLTVFAVVIVFLIINQQDGDYTFGFINLDLLNNTVIWDTHNFANLDNTNGIMNMTLDTSNNDTIYNRIYTFKNISESVSPLVLQLTYSTNSTIGNPQFVFELRTNKTNIDTNADSPFIQYSEIDRADTPIINSIDLGNTLGYQTVRSYQLPSEISNSANEIRFYIISDENTSANLILKNATIISK